MSGGPLVGAGSPFSNSDLRLHPVSLRFYEASDEAAYNAQTFEANRVTIFATLALLIGVIFCTGSDNFGQSTPIIILLAGRLLPILILLTYAAVAMPRGWRWWSHVAAACVFLSVSCLHLVHFMCEQEKVSIGSHMWSCSAVLASEMPWLSPALLTATPFILHTGLYTSWFAACGASLAINAVYFGLVVPNLRTAQTGVAIALPLLLLAVAAVATHRIERTARIAWKSVLCAQRKLMSAVNTSVSKTVGAEQGQRLSQLLKRSHVALYELASDGVYQYVSPACANVLGTAVVEVLAAHLIWSEARMHGFLGRLLVAVSLSRSGLCLWRSLSCAVAPVPHTRFSPYIEAMLCVALGGIRCSALHVAENGAVAAFQLVVRVVSCRERGIFALPLPFLVPSYGLLCVVRMLLLTPVWFSGLVQVTTPMSSFARTAPTPCTPKTCPCSWQA